MSLIEPETALKIAETRIMNAVSSARDLGTRLSRHSGLKSVDLVVLGHMAPSRKTPEPPCMIECYALYAVAEGDERRILRVAYNIAEVWRGKQFGRLYLKTPTEEEMRTPGFDPLSMLRNEVVSHNYERIDPLADVKIQATAAAYLRAAREGAGSARMIYHFSDGKDHIRAGVNEDMIARLEKAGSFARFRSEGCVTESIPDHLLKYESKGPTN